MTRIRSSSSKHPNTCSSPADGPLREEECRRPAWASLQSRGAREQRRQRRGVFRVHDHAGMTIGAVSGRDDVCALDRQLAEGGDHHAKQVIRPPCRGCRVDAVRDQLPRQVVGHPKRGHRPPTARLAGLRQGPDARMDADPHVASPLVGVDVPAMRARSPRCPRRDHSRMSVDVDGQLVEREQGGGVTLEALDVAFVAPPLAGRAVHVLERRRQDRLQHLPRSVAKRRNEMPIELGEDADVVRVYLVRVHLRLSLAHPACRVWPHPDGLRTSSGQPVHGLDADGVL